MTNEQIKHLFELYSSHAGLKVSTVGAYAVNDGKFFDRLAGGGSCTIATAGKLLKWFDDSWPADLEWPREIDRPRRTSSAVAVGKGRPRAHLNDQAHVTKGAA